MSYLNKKTTIVEMDQDEQIIKDALFYEQIVYVVTISENFEEDFKGGVARLEIQQNLDSVNGYLVDNLSNSYLKSTKVYLNNNPSLTLQEIHAYVQEDLKQTANVSLYDGIQQMKSDEIFEKNLRMMFFNYLTYIFLAINILVIGMVMTKINKSEVRMRNITVSTKLTSYNMQLLFANLVFCSTLWMIFMILVIMLSPGMLSKVGYIYV